MKTKIVALTMLFTLFTFVNERTVTAENRLNVNKKKIINTTTLKGGHTVSAKKNYTEILVHITYYTNIDNELQGGQYDRRGNLLVEQGNVIAMPMDVPYGSYLDIDDMGLYKVVDTGGAIVWLNNYECKVDMFIPNVSEEWIYANMTNVTKKARLYVNGEHF